MRKKSTLSQLISKRVAGGEIAAMGDTGNGLPRANRTQLSVGFDGRAPVTESAYHRYAMSGMLSFKSGGTARFSLVPGIF